MTDIRWEDGRLILEVEALIRIPIVVEAITPHTWLSKILLTSQERKVLDGLLRGLCNKEMAALLNVAERTVKFHVSHLLQKFQVTKRVELVTLFLNGRDKPEAPAK